MNLIKSLTALRRQYQRLSETPRKNAVGIRADRRGGGLCRRTSDKFFKKFSKSQFTGRSILSARHTWLQRGIAATEFALTLPIWITMLLGAADGTYCLLVNEKTDRIAYTVTDIVCQYQTISKANLNDIILAAGQLMQPFPFSNNGVVIVTSVYKPTGQTPIVEWQYSGGGTLVKSSKVGTTGGAPTLPNGLTLNDNDNVIISEVYYNFTPMFVNAGLFSSGLVYRVAIYKPRLSLLINTPT